LPSTCPAVTASSPTTAPQQHSLGLLARQGRDERDRRGRGYVVARRAGGVVVGGTVQQLGHITRLDRAPGPRAELVEGAVADNACRPAAERVEVAGEARQVARDLEPGLRGDVLGVLPDEAGGVTHQPGLQRAVDAGERGLVTRSGGGDVRAEVVVVLLAAVLGVVLRAGLGQPSGAAHASPCDLPTPPVPVRQSRVLSRPDAWL